MIRVLVVDDEVPAREMIEQLLEKKKNFEVIAAASHGEEALKIIESTHVDVAFLDVQMPVLNGLEVASRLARLEKAPHVVFVTSHDEYAVKAFEANAIDYIIKPIDPARFEKTLAKVEKLVAQNQSMVPQLINLEKDLLKTGKLKRIIGFRRNDKTRCVIDPQDIVYFEYKYDGVVAILSDQELEIRSTLKDLLEELDSSKFVQTHKAFIVNLDKIDRIEPMFNGNFEIFFKGNSKSKAPLSKKYSQELKGFFGW